MGLGTGEVLFLVKLFGPGPTVAGMLFPYIPGW
jgi:hypothetical protein